MISCRSCGAGQVNGTREDVVRMRVTRIKYAGPQVQRTYLCEVCGATEVITGRLRFPKTSSRRSRVEN